MLFVAMVSSCACLLWMTEVRPRDLVGVDRAPHLRDPGAGRVDHLHVLGIQLPARGMGERGGVVPYQPTQTTDEEKVESPAFGPCRRLITSTLGQINHSIAQGQIDNPPLLPMLPPKHKQ